MNLRSSSVDFLAVSCVSTVRPLRYSRDNVGAVYSSSPQHSCAQPHDFQRGEDSQGARWPRPKADGGPRPWRLLWRALAKAVLCRPPSGCPVRTGLMSSKAGPGQRRARRTRLTSFPSFCWALRGFVVLASCAGSMPIAGGLGEASSSVPRPHSSPRFRNDSMPSISSPWTLHASRTS